MKDTQFPTDPNLEARIVAWVLGEASPFEIAELERHLIEHPELAVFKRRIEAVHGLVDEAVRPVTPLPKLSEERRAKLLATFGAEPAAEAGSVMALKSFRARPWWQLPPAWAAAAACLMVGLVLLWLAIPRSGIFDSRRQAPGGFYLSAEKRTIPVELPRIETDERGRVAQSTSADKQVPFVQYASPPKEIGGRSPAPGLHGLLKNPDAESDSVTQRVATWLQFSERQSREAAAMRAKREEEQRRSALSSAELEAANARRQKAKESPADVVASVGTVGVDASGRSTITLPAFSVVGEHEFSARALASANTIAGSRFAPPMQSDLAMPKPDLPTFAQIGGQAAIDNRPRTFAYAGSTPAGKVAAISATTVSTSRWAAQRFAPAASPTGNLGMVDASASIGGNLPNNLAITSTNGAIALDGSSNVTTTGAGSLAFGPTNVNGLVAPTDLSDVASAKPARPDPSVTLLGPGPSGGGMAVSGGASARDDVVALDSFSVSESFDAKKAESGPVAKDKANGSSSTGMEATNAAEDVQLSAFEVLPKKTAPAAAAEAKAIDVDKPIVHPEQPTDESLRAEVQTQTQSISTFSLHVSDVSFRLAQAALEQGQQPDRDAIRPEEFYNAFDYGDPAPVTGEPVSCRIEQAADPFLQQRNLVRIAMKIPAIGRGAGQPLHLTVLLDTSGSMEREDRVATVRQAFSVLASLLGADDRITLIGFARRPRLLAERVSGTDAKKLVDVVAHTPAEGGTNLEEALKLAGEQARAQFQAGAQNRIVVLTDGAANLGNDDPNRLAAQVAALRQQGISFDACGIGIAGLDDSVLEALTRKGDGRYYVINSPEEADAGFAHKLAGALRPAAENVKVQVRFNPARVQAYRLIGFEQHRLKTEDFRNDQVTAAELAADEGANALYQIQVKPDGEGELGDVFVRFRNAGTGEMVERSWTLAYEAQPAAFDRATPSLQLAGVAAFVAEKLRGGAPAGPIRLADLAPTVNRLRAFYSHDTRVQQLVTMYGQTRRLLNE